MYFFLKKIKRGKKKTNKQWYLITVEQVTLPLETTRRKWTKFKYIYLKTLEKQQASENLGQDLGEKRN